ncbi:ArsO family NAD(P)H-dependent flavin-containing monooxygenase [Acinetobacter brisouii]|uniref:ArsO family NAD(P)H-dependent flavin-containing monooxygenase n=1 Tax=Acinetobacter brisouii TaxID=396323 RepID=UPI00124E738C|nr:ArsO family NAD(P)H-dependent flavin-containing monooxygenase [Acinetobacter brisouii]
MKTTHTVDICIIGGGQAALACAYFLRRTNLSYVILDREQHAGGAWQHAWDSLQLFSPASWSSISGWLMPPTQHAYPTKAEVLNYLSNYEIRYQLPILRPIDVKTVTPLDNDLLVQSAEQNWQAKAVISATGTWSHPYIPYYSGFENFKGMSLHSAHYQNPEALQGQRVLIVGGGNSAAQLVAEISQVATTIWVTQTPPQFLADDVDGRVLFLRATERLKAQQEGRSIEQPLGGFGDIVMVDSVKDARTRGVLVSHPAFSHFTEHHVVWENGEMQEIDRVIWCTGFRPALSHLKALNIIEENQRVLTQESRSIKQPNLWLVGYGDWTGTASATLIGVNRTARHAVAEIKAYLDQRDDFSSP